MALMSFGSLIYSYSLSQAVNFSVTLLLPQEGEMDFGEMSLYNHRLASSNPSS